MLAKSPERQTNSDMMWITVLSQYVNWRSASPTQKQPSIYKGRDQLRQCKSDIRRHRVKPVHRFLKNPTFSHFVTSLRKEQEKCFLAISLMFQDNAKPTDNTSTLCLWSANEGRYGEGEIRQSATLRRLGGSSNTGQEWNEPGILRTVIILIWDSKYQQMLPITKSNGDFEQNRFINAVILVRMWASLAVLDRKPAVAC